jgi:hypothetical protein
MRGAGQGELVLGQVIISYYCHTRYMVSAVSLADHGKIVNLIWVEALLESGVQCFRQP